MTDRCPTCGTERSDTFCGHCGQPRIGREEFSAVNVVKRSMRELFDLDGSLLRSLRLLFLQPGVMAREYCAGRTVPFIGPFKLYLIISAAYFVGAWRPGLEMQQFDQQIGTVISTYLKAYPDLQNNAVFRTAVEERYLDYFAFSRFTNVFVIAAGAALLFRSSRRMYGEHSVFVLHYASFDYAVNTAVIMAMQLLRGYGIIDSFPFSVMMIVTLIYVALASFRFYEGRRVGLVFRSALLFLVDIVTTQLASAVAIAAALYTTIRSMH